MAEGVQRQRPVARQHIGQRRFQIRVGTHGQDRPEDLLAHQVQVVRRVQHHGRHQQALAVGARRVHLRQRDHRHATFARLRQIALQALVLALVDDACVIAGIAEIAIALAHLLLQRLHELALARGVDQHVVRRDAGLPRIEPFAGGQPRSGFFKWKVAANDRRRLAAQFQRDRYQMLGRGGHHLAADGRRAGEQQMVQRQRRHRSRHVRPTLHHRHPIGREHTGQQIGQERTGARRVFRRLQQHVVAGGNRGGQRHQRQRDRVVPGRDHADHAQRRRPQLRARGPKPPARRCPLRLRPAPQVAAQVIDGRQHAHAIGQLRFHVGAMAEILGDGLRHFVQAWLQRLAQAAQVSFALVQRRALRLPGAAQGVQEGGEVFRRSGGHGPTIRGAARRNGSVGRWPATS